MSSPIGGLRRDWLYLNALRENSELASSLTEFEAFTDIAFNPTKSLSCQARSAALYVSLDRRGLLQGALRSKDDFLALFSDREPTQGLLL